MSSFMTYNRSGDLIEITIKDNTFRKISNWKIPASDRKLAKGVLSFISRKYGFDIEEPEKKKLEEKKDIDFLDMKVDW